MTTAVEEIKSLPEYLSNGGEVMIIHCYDNYVILLMPAMILLPMLITQLFLVSLEGTTIGYFMFYNVQ